MAGKMRYNMIIDLLEHGKPVFSTSTVPNGSLDDLTCIADADYDAVIIEMEHEGFRILPWQVLNKKTPTITLAT